MKTIGLIGGMSWESTLEYYRIINQEVNRRLGGFHSAEVVIISVDFQVQYDLHHQGLWDRVVRDMTSAAQRLENAGADLIMIGTNTVHKVADEVQAAVKVPLIHIADAAAAAIKAQGLSTAGLLGTRFTMSEEFYRQRLVDRHGIRVLVPESEDAEIINRAIYDELVHGTIRDDTRQAGLGVIRRLHERGAEGIILGCTELPLLFKQEHTNVPLFDTTTLHALAAVDAALAE